MGGGEAWVMSLLHDRGGRIWEDVTGHRSPKEKEYHLASPLSLLKPHWLNASVVSIEIKRNEVKAKIGRRLIQIC